MQEINFHYLSKLAKAGLFTNSLEMNSLTSLDLKAKIYYLRRTSIKLISHFRSNNKLKKKKVIKIKLFIPFAYFFFRFIKFYNQKKSVLNVCIVHIIS